LRWQGRGCGAVQGLTREHTSGDRALPSAPTRLAVNCCRVFNVQELPACVITPARLAPQPSLTTLVQPFFIESFVAQPPSHHHAGCLPV
jgi:hypothetical protein